MRGLHVCEVLFDDVLYLWREGIVNVIERWRPLFDFFIVFCVKDRCNEYFVFVA